MRVFLHSYLLEMTMSMLYVWQMMMRVFQMLMRVYMGMYCVKGQSSFMSMSMMFIIVEMLVLMCYRYVNMRVLMVIFHQ